MGKENLVEKMTQSIDKRILVLDTTKSGINAIWRDWEVLTLEALLSYEELISREAWKYVKACGNTISRASVILFLNRLVKAGYVTFRNEPCQGGTRRVFKLKLRSWPELNNMVIDRLLFKLWEIFPDNERIKVAVA